jgi:hypothetical protein
MPVNRQESVFLCEVVDKKDPSIIFDSIEVEDLCPSYAKASLKQRFFLKDNQEWRITKLRDSKKFKYEGF